MLRCAGLHSRQACASAALLSATVARGFAASRARRPQHRAASIGDATRPACARSFAALPHIRSRLAASPARRPAGVRLARPAFGRAWPGAINCFWKRLFTGASRGRPKVRLNPRCGFRRVYSGPSIAHRCAGALRAPACRQSRGIVTVLLQAPSSRPSPHRAPGGCPGFFALPKRRSTSRHLEPPPNGRKTNGVALATPFTHPQQPFPTN